jgi:hypothetical protein
MSRSVGARHEGAFEEHLNMAFVGFEQLDTSVLFLQ